MNGKWFGRFRILVALTVVAGLLVACEDDDDDDGSAVAAAASGDAVVGVWGDLTDGTEVLNMNADGTWSWTERMDVMADASGSWTAAGNNTYSISGRVSNGDTYNGTLQLVGERLIVTPHPDTGVGSDEYRRL